MDSFESSVSILNFSKLNKYNFSKWKSDVRMCLLNRGLYGFVDGSEPPLAEGASFNDVYHFGCRQTEALSIIFSSIDKDLRYLVKDVTAPKAAWKALCDSSETKLRTRIAALRSKFVNTKFTPPETMSMFIERLLAVTKELELAGKAIPDDEIAYQMMFQLPKEYKNIVMQLYKLPDESFTSLAVQEALICKYDRIHQCVSNENGTGRVLSAENLAWKHKRLSTEQRIGERNDHYCGLVAQNCQKTQKNTKRVERDTKENKESFLSSQLISNQTKDWIIIPGSTGDFAITEHFSLTFALYGM